MSTCSNHCSVPSICLSALEIDQHIKVIDVQFLAHAAHVSPNFTSNQDTILLNCSCIIKTWAPRPCTEPCYEELQAALVIIFKFMMIHFYRYLLDQGSIHSIQIELQDLETFLLFLKKTNYSVQLYNAQELMWCKTKSDTMDLLSSHLEMHFQQKLCQVFFIDRSIVA